MVATRRVGLIRVLTTTDQDLLAAHGKLIEARFPGLEVVTRCIPGHPEGVYDALTEAAARPKVVALAAEMAEEGVAAVIISCAADPGLDEARQALAIPVIGAGRSAGLICQGLGGKVGVLGISRGVPLAMATALGGLPVEVARPEGVTTTLDLMRPDGKAATVTAALYLKQRGVTVIALACTGMSTIGVAGVIRQEAGLRVVDPVAAAGLFAWYAVSDR